MSAYEVVTGLWLEWMGIRHLAYGHEEEYMNGLPSFNDWTIEQADNVRSLLLQLEGRLEETMPHHPDSFYDYG